MVAIKPLDAIVEKYTTETPARVGYYVKGIEEYTGDWVAVTVAADEARKQGLAEADRRNAWPRGVKRRGTDGWKQKAKEKGGRNYPTGVQTAGPDYRAGFAPYHEVIARITLSKRGPRGAPQNYQRVKELGDALHKKRVGTVGAPAQS